MKFHFSSRCGQAIAALALGTSLFAASEAWSADADFYGNWQTPCVTVSGRVVKNWIHLGEDGRFTIRFVRYINQSCSTPQVVTELTGKYTLSDTALESTGELRAIDYRFESATLTPQTGLAAMSMNSMRTCGLKGWKRGRTVNIAGLDCGEEGLVPAIGGMEYDIVELAGSRLLFGLVTKSSNRRSLEGRPVTLDESLPYYRISDY